jgi:hypothetical protein
MKFKSVRGVKGPCVLSDLKYFNPVTNTNIDFMHSIFLGVVKTLFEYLFDYSSHFSLKKHMTQINLRLANIKPPSFVPYSPRSLFDWKNWRSHEFQYFILFYSLVVFYNLMPEPMYSHLKLLVTAFEILFSKSINDEDLMHASTLLEYYDKQLKLVYDQTILKSGFHELIHLSNMTREFGPLNISCSLQFEEINRKITRIIKGQHLIGDESLKLFNVSRNLSSYISMHQDDNESAVLNFIKKKRSN